MTTSIRADADDPRRRLPLMLLSKFQQFFRHLTPAQSQRQRRTASVTHSRTKYVCNRVSMGYGCTSGASDAHFCSLRLRQQHSNTSAEIRGIKHQKQDRTLTETARERAFSQARRDNPTYIRLQEASSQSPSFLRSKDQKKCLWCD
jgi:hypothetical protein